MDESRIKDKLRELSTRRRHIRFREIETLLDNHIGPRYANYNHHGRPHHAFSLGEHTFNIAEPRKGDFVKKCYVDHFFGVMEALGWYEPKDH